MKEIAFTNINNETIIKWYDCFKYENLDEPQYIRFRFELTSIMFSVKTEYDFQISDISQLAENLELLLNKPASSIAFNPLEEFLKITFSYQKKDEISVNVEISDNELPHNALNYNFIMDYKNVTSLINDLKAIVTDL